jgi:hypothetical protein
MAMGDSALRALRYVSHTAELATLGDALATSALGRYRIVPVIMIRKDKISCN